MTHAPVVIRGFQPGDRAAVRDICVQTADAGHPLDLDFFSDVELFADLLTAWYTDRCPSSVWVAEAGGEVVGYCMGCLNSLAMQREATRYIVFPGLWRALKRGTLLRLSMLKTLWGNARVWTDSLLQRQRHALHYPAQIHVNLRPGFRGNDVGRQLADMFLVQAQEHRVPGVEAAVREDNLPARHFFEKLGFTAQARAPLLFRRGRMVSSVIYGKSLA